MAMHMIISGLISAGHEVKVLAINSNKFFTSVESIPTDFRRDTGIEFEYIDLSIKPLQALKHFILGTSYHVERFISENFQARLRKILSENSFDIIQLETLFMAPYIPLIRQKSQAAIILRAHNIEHRIWKRISESSKNPLKKIYLQHVWKSLKRYEIKQLGNFDGIAAITKADAAFFEGENRGPEVHAISFGIEMNDQTLEKCTEKKNSVFHIGSMDWMPNQEGIQWFLKNVWPRVISQNPELVLYLAGRNTPSWLINKKQEGVEIVGEVEDAGVFMRQHQLMVVPLLSGSGIRIKIIEGMANARAIVTTKIGAEGIAYTSGENLYIAENEEDFAKKILLLAGNDELREKTGEKALELLHQKHNKRELIRDLIAFYKSCLTKKNGR